MELARVMLAMQGYAVLTANSPEKAVRLALGYEGEIDLLLTDVIMPEMNGRDLAGKLLALYPCIKSQFMSVIRLISFPTTACWEKGSFSPRSRFLWKI